MSDWIKCEDRQPAKPGEYLVCYVTDWGGMGLTECEWNGHKWVDTDGDEPVQWNDETATHTEFQ